MTPRARGASPALLLAFALALPAAALAWGERWSPTPPPGEIAPGLAPPIPPSVAILARRAAFDPVATIGIYEGVPYYRDGAVTDSGDFAEWEHLSRMRLSPGLNCSGLVVAATRLLTEKALTVEAARWDRNGDSGPGAPFGQDWDFGWDVALNAALLAADGDPRAVDTFDARGIPHPLSEAEGPVDAQHLRGFSVWDHAAWVRALGAMEQDRFYLGSFSRVGRNGRMLHHHTVLFVVDGPRVWVQGASPKNPGGPRVQSLDATDPDELTLLLDQFASYKSEHLLILGAPLALGRMGPPGGSG